jgi:hypothetical protein
MTMYSKLTTKISTRLGKTLLAAGMIAAMGAASAAPALADDGDGHRGGHQEWRDGRGDRDRHEWREHEGRDHEWRERGDRGYDYVYPRYTYAYPGYGYGYPPPVVYAPQPPTVVIPLNIR